MRAVEIKIDDAKAEAQGVVNLNHCGFCRLIRYGIPPCLGIIWVRNVVSRVSAILIHAKTMQNQTVRSDSVISGG